MTALIWARTVKCDWPGCRAVAEVTLGDDQMKRIMPAGWLDMSQFPIRDRQGREAREICSIHACATLASLIDAFGKEAS